MFAHIQSRISGKSVLVALVLANAIYFVMLGFSIPKLMEYSADLDLFDMSPFGYSYDEAVVLLQALGEDGRSFYLSTQLLLDSFYPALFGIAYLALFQWIMKRGNIHGAVWDWLSILPVFAGVFDYAENCGIWLMLTEFPAITQLQVKITASFTIVKSVLTTLYFAGLLVLVLFVLIHRIKKRRIGSPG